MYTSNLRSYTMGKKTRKKTNNAHPHPMAEGYRKMAINSRNKGMKESFAAMAEMDQLSLAQQKAAMRAALEDMGTDLTKNDADPLGNGDQSKIQSNEGREAAREMYSIGGDIHQHMVDDAVSEFGKMCALGSAGVVQHMINKVQKNLERPNFMLEQMRMLLEGRDTSLRLSPLLLIVSVGKNLQSPMPVEHVEVAKLLLKSGASPDAKDVLGKTVCHYGAGAMATKNTLSVVNMCIEAAKSSHLFGKNVELYDLKKADMNGSQGVVGGYDHDTGRRLVYLSDTKKEVWAKTINIRLVGVGTETELVQKPMLADVTDRLGSISLLEVIMQDRVDVAKFLLQKHQTSIHIKDMDGVCAFTMSVGEGMMMSNVSKMVMDVSRKQGATNRNAKKQATRICAACKKGLGKGGKVCSGCNSIFYCSRTCQVSHWKQHKAECKRLKSSSAGIKLNPPGKNNAFSATMSMSSGSTSKGGAYRIPTGVSPGEKFVVKVQGGGRMPIMVYDESRTCNFVIDYGAPGFKEVLCEMEKESAWNGRKTFMKASFDASGDCTIYPSTAGVKSKYVW